MITEIGPIASPNKILTYQYFHVEVRDARVEARANDPTNIFPTAANVTGLTTEATPENAHLKHKICAAGTDIAVIDYWEAKAPATRPQPSWKQCNLGNINDPSTPADVKAYFEPDPNACVDMMFPDPVVPPSLDPNDVAGVHYCLGRCKNPPIVNTK